MKSDTTQTKERLNLGQHNSKNLHQFCENLKKEYNNEEKGYICRNIPEDINNYIDNLTADKKVEFY